MTAVKICGITNPEDAIAACDYGADAVGFIFFEPSPRYVRPAEVRRIIQTLPRDIAKVGVFVNPEISKVREIWEYCRLDLIQLSGDEPPEFCSQIPAAILLKVVPPSREKDPDLLGFYKVRAFIIDSREGGRFGGTGRLSDWKLAKAVGRNHPVVLSGGLNPENVEAAIAAVSPRAVDVSSGIEIAPGRKDHQKMRAFLEKAHWSGGRGGAGIFCSKENLFVESRKISERNK